MSASRDYYVYITSNPGLTVFYTGVTNDLERRLREHYENRGKPETFAGRYYCYKLVYFEEYNDIRDAIEREKEIKLLRKEFKMDLIKTSNPYLRFLNFP